MGEIALTKEQARRFILRKQGLLDDYRFIGKKGVLEYVHQAGCIQFDPIDVCGKNAELVLQSRVKGFTKQMLYELLYEERKLIDYFDKNLAIVALEDWPYLERFREAYRLYSRGRDDVNKIEEEVKSIIADKGPVSSKDLDFPDKVDWYWSSTKLSRAALESLYFRGELIIHHKKGTNKYYALAKDYIPKELLNAEDPLKEEMEHFKWRVLRRISAVGLLWNKPSDAWLCIGDFKSRERNLVFEELLREEKLVKLFVEGCKDAFYCITEDLALLKEVQSKDKYKGRTEMIAALDNMLWDRKLIKELFDFDYKWEIYTPKEQRNYGYYVLPILMEEQLIGRCEVIAETKNNVLSVNNIWLEKGIKLTSRRKASLERCFMRFMKFHGLKEIQYKISW